MSAWVYIVTNEKRGSLYTGVTSDLIQRIWQHREGVVAGFTSRYQLKRPVWFESHDDIREAIQREKSLKRWSRAWKLELIEKENLDWVDLYPTLF